MTSEKHPSKKTTDHRKIRDWIEARGGKPARVRGTGDDVDMGVLRVAFSDDEKLEPVGWDEFFDKFEAQDLAFLYQEDPVAAEAIRNFEFVARTG